MKPLLSICIPIYNRSGFLKRILERLLEEKSFFQDNVELFVSDNCSPENLGEICKLYQERGLNLQYHRNDDNIGMDGNFANCFRKARGEYVLLLGSDDIPVPGFIANLLPYLKNCDFGLIHLYTNSYEAPVLKLYDDHNVFLSDVGFWVTFISANIVATKYVNDIDFNCYQGSMIAQVPLYLEAACKSDRNAIFSGVFYEDENDSKNNGGYHLFKVFVDNLFGIYVKYVKNGLLSRKSFEQIKKTEYRDFLVGFIVECLIQKRKKSFDIKGSWKILWSHYGHYPYAYVYLAKYLIDASLKRIGIAHIRTGR